MQKEILGMRNHNKRLMSEMEVKTGCNRDVWGESLPDGWYLLLHHHVSQMVVMLGQNKSLDDRLSDLKGKKRQNYSHVVGAQMMFTAVVVTAGRLPTFCRYLATKARCESRCSLVSIISPSFSRFSYS